VKCRCGRTLTDPESRRRGLGPVCWSRLAPEERAQAAGPVGRSGAVAGEGQLAIPVQPTLPTTEPEPDDGRELAPTPCGEQWTIRPRRTQTVPVGSFL
jgi:hypothetical protein